MACDTFSLAQAVPYSQLAFLACFLFATYNDAVVSRHELLLLGRLESPVAGAITDVSKIGGTSGEQVKPAKKADGLGAAGPDSRASGRWRTVIFTAFITLFCLVVVLDLWVIRAATNGWVDIALCILLSPLVASDWGDQLITSKGVTLLSLGRKADGTIVSGFAKRSGAWDPRCICILTLAAVSILPSLASKPQILAPLLYLSNPVRTERFGVKTKLKKLLLSLSDLLSSIYTVVGVGVISYLLVSFCTITPTEGLSGTDHLTEADVVAYMPFAIRCLPEMLCQISLCKYFVPVFTCLYRFDYAPTEEEVAALEVVYDPASGKSEHDPVGRKILYDRRLARRAAPRLRLRLNYSSLAVGVTMSWMVLPPVLFEYLLPSFPTQFLVPWLRFFSCSAAALSVMAATSLLATCRGERSKLFAYEEDWGVRHPDLT